MACHVLKYNGNKIGMEIGNYSTLASVTILISSAMELNHTAPFDLTHTHHVLINSNQFNA